MKHYQIWIKWMNTGAWQMTDDFHSALHAREYFQNRISTSGGRIARVELRECTADTGEALFDILWR
jgi:hypothetical protein